MHLGLVAFLPVILALGPVGGTENGEDCVLCECDGRVVKEEQGGERVESEYGPHGLRVRMRTSRGHVLEIERDIVKKIIDGLRGPVSFEHDGLGNLTAAVYGDGEVDLRMPDRVGNLFRTGERKDRKYGPAGQLLESVSKAGTTRYAYDPEGNLVKKTLPDGSAWTYEWNAAGMLAKVIRPDGKVVAFGYDALGRRVWKTYKGKTTRWVWDGNVPVHEWVEVEEPAVSPAPERIEDSQDAGIRQRGIDLSQRHAQGPPTPAIQHGTADGPITWVFDPESFAPAARLAGGEQHAIITDHLGTPTAMLDVAGRPVWSADIGIWGELRNLVGDKQACPFRWPGQYEDEETGLYYNRFRYYDPDSGEYVTQDPIGLRGGLRSYGYVGDPLCWVDPLGLKKGGVRCGGTGAGGGAARGGAGVVRVGQAGEAVARSVADIGPKLHITVAGRARIPDGLNLKTRVLSEVKNVGSLSYTQQLRDFAAYASANGLRFDLWVRPTTQLSGPLAQEVANRAIKLRYIP